MKRLILLAALLVCISASGQTLLPISGYCNQGGVSAVTSGQSSQNFLQGVVPSCTVTVFASGTQNKVTIYANAQGATLGNPFTANNAGSSNPGFWVFYVPIDSLVDVQLSGGISPNLYKSPVVIPGGAPGSGGISGSATSGTYAIGTGAASIGPGYISESSGDTTFAHPMIEPEHLAFGANATLNGGATSVPASGQNVFTPTTVETLQEASTAADGVNGLYVESDYSPATTPDDSSTPYAGFFNLQVDQDNATGSSLIEPTGLVAAVNVTGNSNPGTTAEPNGIFESAAVTGNGNIGQVNGVFQADGIFGNGNTHLYSGFNQNFVEAGTGTVDEAYGYVAALGAITGTISLIQGFRLDGPYDCPPYCGTVGEFDGIYLSETAWPGYVTTPYQIKSVGTAPSYFAGPIQASNFYDDGLTAGLVGAVSATPPSSGGTSYELATITALPTGTTATTQIAGDNTTKVATDAFVIANAGGATTNALTMNNSGSGASPGTAFNGSAAETISYNTIGAQQALTLTTTGSSGAASLSGGTLNIPEYSGGGGATLAFPGIEFATSATGGRVATGDTDYQSVLSTPSAASLSPLTVQANDVFAQNCNNRFSDGTPYCSAGPAYASYGMFIDDQTLACLANPGMCPASLLLNMLSKEDANYSNTLGYPINIYQNLSTINYFSAWDQYQHTATGDGRIMVPVDLYLYCQKVGPGSSACTTEYTNLVTHIKAAWSLVPRDSSSHLYQVVPGAEYVCGTAFMEYMRNTGLVANCNVWAAIDDADMIQIATAAGDSTNVTYFTNDLALLVAGIRANLIDGSTGLLIAATINNASNDDVPSSALAVAADSTPGFAPPNILTSGEKSTIASYFYTNYSTLVNAAGFVLETPKSGGWATIGYIPSSGGPPYGSSGFTATQYQGGFWTFHAGWFATAMAQANEAEVGTMLGTFLNGVDPGCEYFNQGSASCNGTTPNLESPQWAVATNIQFPLAPTVTAGVGCVNLYGAQVNSGCSGGGGTYPGAGLAVSTGSAWGTSLSATSPVFTGYMSAGPLGKFSGSSNTQQFSGAGAYEVIDVENSNAAGTSGFNFFNNSNASIGGFGLGNPSFGLAWLQGVTYAYGINGFAITATPATANSGLFLNTSNNATFSNNLTVNGTSQFNSNMTVDGSTNIALTVSSASTSNTVMYFGNTTSKNYAHGVLGSSGGTYAGNYFFLDTTDSVFPFGFQTQSGAAVGAGVPSNGVLGFFAATGASTSSAIDTAFSRASAGVIDLGNGTAGNASGTLDAALFGVGSGAGISGGTNVIDLGNGTSGNSTAAVYGGSFVATVGGFESSGGGIGFQAYSLGTATSGANYNSDPITLLGSYWNGSTHAADDWTWVNTLGTGTNPTSTLTLAHAGSNGTVNVAYPGLIGPVTLYSAAGTALPSCTSALKGQEAVVSDASVATFLGTYSSGGSTVSPVLCNGTNWVTY